LHIATHLGIANFLTSNGWISRFKRRHNRVLIQKLWKTWKITNCCKKLMVMTSLAYVMLVGPVYFSIYNVTKLSLFKEIFARMV
jgi:hypothetical protein